MKVRRIEPDDWREWKASRLRALADSPQAFAGSFVAEEQEFDETWSEYARHCSASHASAAGPDLAEVTLQFGEGFHRHSGVGAFGLT